MQAASEGKVLDFYTPTPSSIIAYGDDNQFGRLKDYAGIRAQTTAANYGLQRPPTRSEILKGAQGIREAYTRQGAVASAKLAIDTGELTTEQALRELNAKQASGSLDGGPFTEADLTGGPSAPTQAPLDVESLYRPYQNIPFLPGFGGVPAGQGVTANQSVSASEREQRARQRRTNAMRL
jgi:hypothetical protein